MAKPGNATPNIVLVMADQMTPFMLQACATRPLRPSC